MSWPISVPTERAVGSRNPLNANLSALLPTLKMLAHAGSSTIHVNVEMIDLARQKVGLRSSDVRELDWSVVKGALEESSSGKIDLKSLEERHQRAAFLTAELKRVIGEETQAQRVVVVLTNPVIFEGSVEPLAVEDSAQLPDHLYPPAIPCCHAPPDVVGAKTFPAHAAAILPRRATDPGGN